MSNDGYTENTYWMLLQIAFRAKHGLMKLAEAHNLTVIQMYTLCTMSPKGAVPMNTISHILLCDASTVTGIVDRLLMQGYVAREENPEDRRVKMITLTPAGEKLRYQVLGALSEYEIPEFKRLSGEQFTQLHAIAATILQSPADSGKL
jgi:DNA-binding MarR family transcriptional regulator